MDSHCQIELITQAIDGIPDNYKSVLCVGCGDGTECDEFIQKNKKVTGIALNIKFIKKKNDYNLLKMDMHDLTFDDNSFDLVFCKDTFEHAISHVLAYSEMARVARKYLLITLPDFEEWKRGRYHYLIPTKEQIEILGEKFGLRIVKHWYGEAEGHARQDNYLFTKKL